MAGLGPKKDGGPNIDFFQSAESMVGLETVRLWLQKNCKKVFYPPSCFENMLRKFLIFFLYIA